MIDRKRLETNPAETPPGERGYVDLPVRGTSQGPRSLGASEAASENVVQAEGDSALFGGPYA